MKVAIELAGKVNGHIHLVHAYKLVQRAGSFIGIEEMMRKDAEKDMQALLEKYRETQLLGIQMGSSVVKGETKSVISQLTDDLDIDLVVMGTQGSSGLKEVFIGSVTNNVINKTRIPVLAIPALCDYKPIERITLAIDGKGVDDVKIYRPLLEIAAIYESSLSIIHVAESEAESKKPQQELMELVAGLKPNVHSIVSDDISEAITEFVASDKSDLLCLVKRERGFINSLFHVSQTKRSVFYTEVPLLVLRES